MDNYIHTDNMRISFNIATEYNIDIETLIKKPIVSNNICIGFISEAKYDDSKTIITCNGIVWDKFINIEQVKNNSYYEISAINIT